MAKRFAVFFRAKVEKLRKRVFFFLLWAFIHIFGFCRRYFRSAKERKRGFPFRLCSLIRTLAFAEGTFARQRKEKGVFLSVCARLFVPLYPILRIIVKNGYVMRSFFAFVGRCSDGKFSESMNLKNVELWHTIC